MNNNNNNNSNNSNRADGFEAGSDPRNGIPFVRHELRSRRHAVACEAVTWPTSLLERPRRSRARAGSFVLGTCGPTKPARNPLAGTRGPCGLPRGPSALGPGGARKAVERLFHHRADSRGRRRSCSLSSSRPGHAILATSPAALRKWRSCARRGPSARKLRGAGAEEPLGCNDLDVGTCLNIAMVEQVGHPSHRC